MKAMVEKCITSTKVGDDPCQTAVDYMVCAVKYAKETGLDAKKILGL